ncbi:hypothetical protein [Corynebacterium atrinae]|uniref:hypothetical protein n=1 Tax=Corynebacterium atrinae TaxID=1336740 RepID=UPI0025B4EB55|nr:hypothetical protein [Corynebacterium atrinae]
MTPNLLVMPASPALVAELSPQDTIGAAALATLRELIDALPDALPIELVGSRNPRWETACEGSFRAWGAPHVNVGAGRFLPELVQRYALAERASRVVSVRGTLGQPAEGVITIVAVDGSAGLTPRAPLALLEAAPRAHEWCRAVLGGEDVAGEMDAASLRTAGVIEPDLWMELAALAPREAQVHFADLSLGVGRFVAGWEL